MGDIFKDFECLELGIQSGKEVMDRLYKRSEEVRSFAEIQKTTIFLEEQKRALEPKYYEAKMRCCDHLFAECSRRHYNYEIGVSGETNYNMYDLYIEHYCLKCGCTTKRLWPSEINELKLNGTSTAIVPIDTQIKIAKSSISHSIVDFGEFNMNSLIVLWRKIQNDNKNLNNKLSFQELICILKDEVEEIKSNTQLTPKCLVKHPKVYTHRDI